ncbi:MAG: hypothetical protein Q9219_006680 [cf. Caloplaca sp. 3 TL-2023]
MFRRIGQGFCGTVWAPEVGACDFTAVKREDGGPGRSLHNDYIMHRKILSHSSPSQSYLRIPACYRYISSEDSSWDELRQRFPSQFQIPCNSLITERIPPFSQDVRERIVEKYCPDHLKASITSSEPDRDCLVRPYLGRRRHSPGIGGRPRFQAFSLRNYPLHLNQLEDLSLDSVLYAKIMADTLANLFWNAKVDANDIEFVLAPQSSNYTGPFSGSIHSPFLGDHVVWILDFDCCKHMSTDIKGVEQAVTAFYKNDPFYPRPGRSDKKDQELWNEFKAQFLKASKTILEHGSPEACLADLWIDLVEKRVQ